MRLPASTWKGRTSPRNTARAAHIRASSPRRPRLTISSGGRTRPADTSAVTLAPEVPGALPLIEYLRANGIRVGIGHTAASADIIRDAIKAGATLSTHLGNGAAQMIPGTQISLEQRLPTK